MLETDLRRWRTWQRPPNPRQPLMRRSVTLPADEKKQGTGA